MAMFTLVYRPEHKAASHFAQRGNSYTESSTGGGDIPAEASSLSN
jgi:hypothetical protein